MYTKKLYLILASLFFLSAHWCKGMHVFDNPHFFNANCFFGEPLFEKPCLTSLDLVVRRGSTSTARNCTGEKVCLLSLYGPEKLAYLKPFLLENRTPTASEMALLRLSDSAGIPGFGQLSFSGKVSVSEAIFLATQNISHGFFVQLHVPCIKIKVRDVCYQDASCAQDVPEASQQAWSTFLDVFPTLLKEYGIHLTARNELGIGDVSPYIGWTCNYQDTEKIDYVDTTLKLGLIIPTSSEKNESLLFDIPIGYNGHKGLSACADISMGAYEWLTVGAHIRGLFFADHHRFVRMKTDPHQSGFLKLSYDKALVHHGSIVEVGTYIKADHIIRGFSLLCGYAYTAKAHDTLKANGKNAALFSSGIINSDRSLASWNMHTMNYAIEYDFTREQSTVGTRINAYMDQQVSGKNVFATNMAGVGLGIDIAW